MNLAVEIKEHIAQEKTLNQLFADLDIAQNLSLAEITNDELREKAHSLYNAMEDQEHKVYKAFSETCDTLGLTKEYYLKCIQQYSEVAQ